ncbi:MAG: hypothetical protein ABRQ26_04095 [Syntrophomonadaceae bacterium]
MNWSGKGLFTFLLILLCLSSPLFCSRVWAGDLTGMPSSVSDGQQVQPHSGSDQPGSPPPGRPGGIRPQGNVNPQPAPGGPAASSGLAGSGAQLERPVLIGAIFLLIGAAISGFLLFRKKINLAISRESLVIMGLLCLGLVIRLVLAGLMTGHPYDMGLFVNWASAAARDLGGVYSNNRVDYPPLYMYVLYLAGKAISFSWLHQFSTVILKLPAIFADLVTSYFIFSRARKHLNPTLASFLAAFYLFNPAVLINSSLWGQVDSFFTCLLVAALIMLAENRVSWASVLFAAAVLMKPQGIIFLPVLFFELVRQKDGKLWLKSVGMAAVSLLVIILPFALRQGPFWIIELYMKTLGEYPFASVNAFNLFNLLGANYTRYTESLGFMNYQGWGMFFIVAVTAIGWLVYARANNVKMAWATALLLISGVFTLAAGMHERYLFPALALSLFTFVYLGDRRFLFMAGGFSVSIFLNTHAVLFATIRGVHSLAGAGIPAFTAILNLLLLVYLVKVMLDVAVVNKSKPIPISDSNN